MTNSDLPQPASNPSSPKIEHLHRRRHISVIWLIPIVAAAIAAYLGWVTYSQRGPVITIYLHNADGLEPGKTQIKYKAITFGTVKSIGLAPDGAHVAVTAEMTKQAGPLMREGTNFWVVRFRLSAGSGLSGLSTIVSGAYIEFDPSRDGKPVNSFTGLEMPPVIQSDTPGTAFTLKTTQLGSVDIGSPIFYRGIEVGQVLGYDSSDPAHGIAIHAFVREPYDKDVRNTTSFWSASGISLTTGPQGFRLRLQSLQAFLGGGIAFDTPEGLVPGAVAPPGASFDLHDDEVSADEAQYSVHLKYLVFFDSSVGGLAPGSSVEWHGLKVGQVVHVGLQYDAAKHLLRAPVIIEIEPQRVEIIGVDQRPANVDVLEPLVTEGLRAQIKTSNFLTGQSVVSLDIDPKAKPEHLGTGEAFPVIPTSPNQLDSAMRSANDILDHVSKLPLDKLVSQANETLKSFQDLAAGPEVKQSLQSLSAALISAQALIEQTKTDLGPAMQKLPPVLDAAQQSMRRINSTLGSFDDGYGGSSSFKRDTTRLMAQVDDAVRSIRALSDYLEQHPESLVRGKAQGE